MLENDEPLTNFYHLNNKLSSSTENNTSLENASLDHNHTNGTTTSSPSSISTLVLKQKPQLKKCASNILSNDLINSKKRKFRATRPSSTTLLNRWWPFGLFLLLFYVLISSNVASALATNPSNSLNLNNRIESLPQNVRWKRNIVQEPIQKDTSTSKSQKLIETPIDSTQNPILITSTHRPSILETTPTPQITNDEVLLDPDSVFIFRRTVFMDNEKFVNPAKKTEIFNINSSMNGTLKFVCYASVQNRRLLLYKNITFETYWVDAKSTEIMTNDSVLTFENVWEAIKGEDRQYRCAARLSLPSRSIDSVVHSRALIIRAVHEPVLKITPEKVEVLHMQRVRLECQYNISADQIQTFYWRRNDVLIFQTDEYKIYNVQDRSILYIFKAHILHAGEYSCHVLLNDDQLLNSNQTANVRIYDDVKNLTRIQEQILPSKLLEGRVGEELFMECWKPGTKETRWYRLHASMKEIVSSDPVLVFKNPSASLNGKYECQLEDDFGLVEYYSIDVFVDDNFFKVEPILFSIVRKHQGTPAKLLCRTFTELDETPQMASWYRNGRLLDTPEDRVYRRSSLVEDGRVKGNVIYVAMAQIEDQGFYECVIRRGDTERTQQTLMLVEQTTNVTLKNLNMTVNHVRGCFSSQFELPEDIDQRLAQFSTFFLVYFNADMTKPLNIIPGILGAKCTKNQCIISCWQNPSYPFDPATTYTFRISAVFADRRSVITSLSDAVNATSWDGPASRAVHLDWLHDSKKNELELRWKRPSVVGTLQEYQLELMEIDDSPQDLDHRRKKYKILIGADEEKYRLNVSAPFSIQFRLIPLTRSGPPSSHQLQSLKDFGYTLISVDEDSVSQPMDASIPPPEIKIHQINSEPKLELHFDRPTAKEYNVTSIRVQFRPLMSLQNSPLESKENLGSDGAEELRNDGKTTIILKKGLKLGTLYQICVAYEKLTVPSVLGFWHCENVPLFDESGQLNPIRAEEYSNEPRNLIPRPVNCQRLGCHCVQSKEDHNLVLIKWKTNGDSNYRSSAASSYIIHFTLNETDPDLEKDMLKSRFYKDGNETVAELRGLFPSLTYRIMIEAQNEQGKGLEGTYFTCKSPKNLHLPPPTSGHVILLGEKVAQVQWKTPLPSSLIHLTPDFDGYILHWRTGNASEQSEFVAGHDSNSIMLATLHPGFEYSAYLTSHSSITGDSPLMSQPFVIRIPADKPVPTPGKKTKEDKLKSLLEADAARPWYKTLRFRAYVILALIGLLIIVCCSGLAALISMKYYDWYQSPEAKKRRRENKNKKAPPSIAGMSSGRASIASSRASLNSVGSGSRQPNLMETEQLIPSNIYGLPMFRDSKHKRNVLDLKGGPHGYKPKGEKKTRKLLSDPEFSRRVSETNKDPTGLGKTWSEVLAYLKRTQEEEIAMIEKRRQEEIEMQTFCIQHQPTDPEPSTSNNKRHRPKLQRQTQIPTGSPATRQISSIDDEDEEVNKKESVQAEIHPQPFSRKQLFNTSNRPPSKTHSLIDVKNTTTPANFMSDTRLLDPTYIIHHPKQSRHFRKRPSIISLQNVTDPHFESPSNLTTPNTPRNLCSNNRVIEGPICMTSTPIEFHFGANGIERRRLKTTTATPVHQQHRKKFSASGSTTTASLPNLADSGIVYDEMLVVGHANGYHHHSYFHHPSHDCPTALHPITSMKILRLSDDDEEERKEVEENLNCPQSSTQEHQCLERRKSVGAVDGESAVSTSSGASSRDSGSNRYEEEEEVDQDEESQLISPQTPIRTFIPPPTLTKDYCAIQICNFPSTKEPLENDEINSGWFHGNV